MVASGQSAAASVDAEPVRFGLWYDLRNPAPWRRPYEQLYREVLDQITWAEDLGFASVWLTEHHFCDDGYTPSPLVVAAAIAERTSTMRIGTNLMLLPLHDPIRLAEDAATVSILSGGRFDLGVGLGYRQVEFDAFGRDLRHRPSLLEEGVEVIRRAWAGESVGGNRRRFPYPDVTVQPVPSDPPRLLIGGMVEPAIDRVARIGDGFLSTQNAHHGMYLDAMARHHGNTGSGRIFAGQWALVSDDPERTWAQAGPHAVYQLNEYVRWGAFGPPEQVPTFPDPAAVLAGGAYQVWEPDTAVDELSALLRSTPQIRDVHFWAQLPGEAIDHGSARIELLATQVIPRVRASLTAASTANP
jgi:alkanesulfonate monooxygenase SsuD/methylene tetrahydromethanopterin reductase-like flavin-dependent oxidoreductase (luciferase family)